MDDSVFLVPKPHGGPMTQVLSRPTSVLPRFVRGFVVLVSLFLALASIGLCDNQATTVRVASISFEPVKFDLAENTKTLDAWFRKAAKGSAKIAVTPEGALEGYVVDGIIAEDVDAERMREVCF